MPSSHENVFSKKESNYKARVKVVASNITRGFVSRTASGDKNLFNWCLWLCCNPSFSIPAGLQWEFKDKKITMVWKSGRKTLVSFWKMSTGWHTHLQGSFVNVKVLTLFFVTYIYQENLKCLVCFTFCVSLRGFCITQHYRTFQQLTSKQTVLHKLPLVLWLLQAEG